MPQMSSYGDVAGWSHVRRAQVRVIHCGEPNCDRQCDVVSLQDMLLNVTAEFGDCWPCIGQSNLQPSHI